MLKRGRRKRCRVRNSDSVTCSVLSTRAPQSLRRVRTEPRVALLLREPAEAPPQPPPPPPPPPSTGRSCGWSWPFAPLSHRDVFPRRETRLAAPTSTSGSFLTDLTQRARSHRRFFAHLRLFTRFQPQTAPDSAQRRQHQERPGLVARIRGASAALRCSSVRQTSGRCCDSS